MTLGAPTSPEPKSELGITFGMGQNYQPPKWIWKKQHNTVAFHVFSGWLTNKIPIPIRMNYDHNDNPRL
jgi:hypothetical protein